MVEAKRIRIEKAYANLLAEINQRQEFEQNNPIPPYSDHPTTYDYFDITGNTLLCYAATLGDMTKVQECLAKGAAVNSGNIKINRHPIALALMGGNIGIAELLLNQGANCVDIHAEICRDTETRIWFESKIMNALEHDDSKEQFFTSRLPSLIDKLMRAAEVGNIRLIGHFLGQVKVDDYQSTVDSLLVVCARNGKLNAVNNLINAGAHANQKQTYAANALNEAAVFGHLDVVNRLLEAGADPSRVDEGKCTALMKAIENGSADIVDALVKKNINIAALNIAGDTAVHYCAKSSNPVIIKSVLGIPGADALLDVQNIYGYSPKNLAIINKNDLFLTAQNPDVNLDEIRSSPLYGCFPAMTVQSEAVMACRYYLSRKYRDNDFFSEDGKCNGLAYLHEYYAAKGMEAYFFDTLALLGRWDGTDKELNDELLLVDTEYKKYYHSLGDVFEQWINDISYLQHTEVSEIFFDTRFSSRDKHMLFVGEDERYRHVSLYQTSEKEDKLKSIAQVAELLKFLAKMPPNIRYEINSDIHATSGHIEAEGKINYYDPNYVYRPTPVADADELTLRVLNYLYFLTGKLHDPGDKLYFILRTFCFSGEFNKIGLEHFHVFSEAEFPNSREAAQDFQRRSSNNFTHLHVAVMTGSILDIQKLVNDGYCDLSAEDCNHQTALQLALSNGFDAATVIIAEKLDFQAKLNLLVAIVEANNLALLDRISINDHLGVLLKKAINLNNVGMIKYFIKKIVGQNNEIAFPTVVELKNIDAWVCALITQCRYLDRYHNNSVVNLFGAVLNRFLMHDHHLSDGMKNIDAFVQVLKMTQHTQVWLQLFDKWIDAHQHDTIPYQNVKSFLTLAIRSGAFDNNNCAEKSTDLLVVGVRDYLRNEILFGDPSNIVGKSPEAVLRSLFGNIYEELPGRLKEKLNNEIATEISTSLERYYNNTNNPIAMSATNAVRYAMAFNISDIKFLTNQTIQEMTTKEIERGRKVILNELWAREARHGSLAFTDSDVRLLALAVKLVSEPNDIRRVKALIKVMLKKSNYMHNLIFVYSAMSAGNKAIIPMLAAAYGVYTFAADEFSNKLACRNMTLDVIEMISVRSDLLAQKLRVNLLNKACEFKNPDLVLSLFADDKRAFYINEESLTKGNAGTAWTALDFVLSRTKDDDPQVIEKWLKIADLLFRAGAPVNIMKDMPMVEHHNLFNAADSLGGKFTLSVDRLLCYIMPLKRYPIEKSGDIPEGQRLKRIEQYAQYSMRSGSTKAFSDIVRSGDFSKLVTHKRLEADKYLKPLGEFIQFKNIFPIPDAVPRDSCPMYEDMVAFFSIDQIDPEQHLPEKRGEELSGVPESYPVFSNAMMKWFADYAAAAPDMADALVEARCTAIIQRYLDIDYSDMLVLGKLNTEMQSIDENNPLKGIILKRITMMLKELTSLSELSEPLVISLFDTRTIRQATSDDFKGQVIHAEDIYCKNNRVVIMLITGIFRVDIHSTVIRDVLNHCKGEPDPALLKAVGNVLIKIIQPKHGQGFDFTRMHELQTARELMALYKHCEQQHIFLPPGANWFKGGDPHHVLAALKVRAMELISESIRGQNKRLAGEIKEHVLPLLKHHGKWAVGETDAEKLVDKVFQGQLQVTDLDKDIVKRRNQL